MLTEVELKRAFRATPTGLYLYTTSRDGVPNVQFAFRAVGVWEDPPLLLIGMQTGNYSYETVQQTGELVLNTCSAAHVGAIDRSRGLSGRDTEDKFAILGLTPLPAKHVAAPLVKDSYCSVECRLIKELGLAEGVAVFLVQGLACYVDEEHPPVTRLVGKTHRLGDLLD
ncbi:MAG TPA: flavin reductase family protein [Chloroflexota bacterium]|jgi:flavin reductase (DIM6/NTAB) family NADH-FMN oxidoreductase RutF